MHWILLWEWVPLVLLSMPLVGVALTPFPGVALTPVVGVAPETLICWTCHAHHCLHGWVARKWRVVVSVANNLQ